MMGKERKHRLCLALAGGLGNQMFQYAAGRALSLRNGAELVVDTWSGFVHDTQYHRSYELHQLPIQARAAIRTERLPIWLFRAENRFRVQPSAVLQRRTYGDFLVENERRYLAEAAHHCIERTTWMAGYWQSPLYFADFSQTIRDELMPLPPCQERFLELGRLLRSTESVALGIRLYEESANPAVHSRSGRVKSVHEINAAIGRLLGQRPAARLCLFCTHRSPLLAELNVPQSTIFVTNDDGYQGTLENLWLMTQCHHHIFTNSSYYWWGAYLSGAVYTGGQLKQHIFAADNFINEHSLMPDWQHF